MRVQARKASEPTYAQVIAMQPGERLELIGDEDEGWMWARHSSGQEGWVPLSFLEQGVALRAYIGTELPVAEGEIFTVLELHSGWLWCGSAEGALGWVRASQVESLPD